MARHFQIAEFGGDPFDEQTEGDEGLQKAARGRRVEDAETVEYHDGVPSARRVTLPEVELVNDVMSFRERSQSVPPNFWIAVQYGRELRRMSDEFVSTFTETKGLHISRSAGTIVTRFYQKVANYFPGKDGPGCRQTDNH